MGRGRGDTVRKVLYMLGELEDTDLQWLVDAGNGKRFAAGGVLVQEGDYYRNPVEVLIRLSAGGARTLVVEPTGMRTPFTTVLAGKVGSVELDPRSLVLRKPGRD